MAEDLVLLLELPVPTTKVAQFARLFPSPPRTVSILDIGLAHPVRQAKLGDPEVVRDLRKLLARFTILPDAQDLVTELLEIGRRHDVHPSLRCCSAPQMMCHPRAPVPFVAILTPSLPERATRTRCAWSSTGQGAGVVQTPPSDPTGKPKQMSPISESTPKSSQWACWPRENSSTQRRMP